MPSKDVNMTNQAELTALPSAELTEYKEHCAQISEINSRYNLEQKWQFRISPIIECPVTIISAVSMFQAESRLASGGMPTGPKTYQGVRIDWGWKGNGSAASFDLRKNLEHTNSKKIDEICNYLLPAIGRACEMEKFGISIDAPMPWCFASTPFLARLTRFHAEHQDGNHGNLARQKIGETHGIIHTVGDYSIFGATSYEWSGPGEPEKIILQDFSTAIDDDETETDASIPEAALQGMKGIALSRVVAIDGMNCDDIIIESAAVEENLATYENQLVLYLQPLPLTRCGNPPTGVEHDPVKAWMSQFV